MSQASYGESKEKVVSNAASVSTIRRNRKVNRNQRLLDPDKQFN